eukprot:gnl/Carplike_NY0171/4110_a5559_276.p1 GENE.gnl/Carplike_NY0171/4110_a5559_276~~gnl/Carplike_NY0171/4110_a5559_276.p1  ORF type:complete len:484 (-),score=122.68 gnl/Carplike_NY0171/4110_a5559_276:434-1702(-)
MDKTVSDNHRTLEFFSSASGVSIDSTLSMIAYKIGFDILETITPETRIADLVKDLGPKTLQQYGEYVGAPWCTVIRGVTSPQELIFRILLDLDVGMKDRGNFFNSRMRNLGIALISYGHETKSGVPKRLFEEKEEEEAEQSDSKKGSVKDSQDTPVAKSQAKPQSKPPIKEYEYEYEDEYYSYDAEEQPAEEEEEPEVIELSDGQGDEAQEEQEAPVLLNMTSSGLPRWTDTSSPCSEIFAVICACTEFRPKKKGKDKTISLTREIPKTELASLLSSIKAGAEVEDVDELGASLGDTSKVIMEHAPTRFTTTYDTVKTVGCPYEIPVYRPMTCAHCHLKLGETFVVVGHKAFHTDKKCNPRVCGICEKLFSEHDVPIFGGKMGMSLVHRECQAAIELRVKKINAKHPLKQKKKKGKKSRKKK